MLTGSADNQVFSKVKEISESIISSFESKNLTEAKLNQLAQDTAERKELSKDQNVKKNKEPRNQESKKYLINQCVKGNILVID